MSSVDVLDQIADHSSHRSIVFCDQDHCFSYGLWYFGAVLDREVTAHFYLSSSAGFVVGRST